MSSTAMWDNCTCLYACEIAYVCFHRYCVKNTVALLVCRVCLQLYRANQYWAVSKLPFSSLTAFKKMLNGPFMQEAFLYWKTQDAGSVMVKKEVYWYAFLRSWIYFNSSAMFLELFVMGEMQAQRSKSYVCFKYHLALRLQLVLPSDLR